MTLTTHVDNQDDLNCFWMGTKSEASPQQRRVYTNGLTLDEIEVFKELESPLETEICTITEVDYTHDNPNIGVTLYLERENGSKFKHELSNDELKLLGLDEEESNDSIYNYQGKEVDVYTITETTIVAGLGMYLDKQTLTND